jgi:enterochelin esterase-like enzyme
MLKVMEQANRDAAHRVAEQGLPEGANLRRVYRPLRPAELAERLAERREGAWRDDEDVVFCWRGSASAVSVWFGIVMALDHLDGTDLWVLVVRIRDLDRAAFSYRFLPEGDGERPWGEPSGTWRGPDAPPAPVVAQTLVGELRTVELDSAALGERRRLHVYLPPGHDRRNPVGVLYATDGRVSAELIEPLILAGRIPPIVSVGVPFGEDRGADRRAQEYLPGFHPEHFEAHRRFFVEEVSAWAEVELGVAAGRKFGSVFGVSNGAAFAAAMGVRHPEYFGTVIAFSLAITGATPTWEPGEAPRHYLCAGSLEEGFDRGTRHWAQIAGAAGAEVVHRSWVSGHDPVMWDGELPRALEWTYGSRG